MHIHLHNETELTDDNQNAIVNLAEWICSELRLPILSVDLIFVDDDTLRSMHASFLQDETFTDVMTFNLGEADQIEGEIYISPDRAAENAKTYGVSLSNELFRLVIHACLHLAGYDDKSDDLRAVMKEREDYFLSQASELFGQMTDG
ncbi:MAG: rRNA maturation RNase YbeY [Calditrichales bacterium]|nr:MAG: rRNA maturation RNase YbeY [Calditrichales bacterium]